MINVYLDDLRPCPKGYKYVQTADECIKLISKNSVNVLSLDHDLGFGKPSGYEVVKYMVQNRTYPKKIVIHSANPFGRFRMLRLLIKHKPRKVILLVRPEPLYI
ncbi:cyclic-phosphate processing receiver domain-containing protein [Paenibacillus ginsengarvi]|uniref:Cell division protein FtsJ n=1 Tax=Paenibacillus ginsengarvi TaxID=400777 RepID=A0A3B0CH68_9BACL|nr:cell division protein FtsJ [Paenibacillus ginsengarvi]